MFEENFYFYLFIILVGTIILVIVFTHIHGLNKYKNTIKKQINVLLNNTKPYESEIVTKEEVNKLPKPVQKFLSYSGVIGKKKPQNIRLEQKGALRTQYFDEWRKEERKRWLPFKAVQYISTNPPGFIWFANVKSFQSTDILMDGKGSISTNKMGFRKKGHITGKEVDEGSLLRYIAEMIWFPAAMVNDYIRWEAIDDTSAKATIKMNDKTVSGTFKFDKEGKIVNFIGERHFHVKQGHHVFGRWETPVEKYKEISGIKIPSFVKGVWDFDGDAKQLLFSEALVSDVQYDVNEANIKKYSV
jgi:hypothetical protein